MNTSKTSIFLVALFFSSIAFSQSSLHQQSIPILTSNANNFAYVAENLDGIGGSLYLAKITGTFPVIKAENIAQLENYNSGQYAVRALGTSPDNHYLVSFRGYHSRGDYTDILEWDSHPENLRILLYDLHTGEYLGLIDYSPWGSLNESIMPSEQLEEFRHEQIEAGVPPEVVAEYDYVVNNENSANDFFDLRWNSDGTIGVTFFPEVWVRHETIFQSLGSELFMINYTVNPSGISLESHGDIKTPAAWPTVFELAAEEPLPGNLQLESRDILFPERVSLFPGLDLTVLRPKKGVLIEGGIPAAYWNF